MNNNDLVPGFDDEEVENLKIRLQRIEEVPGCLVLYLTGYVDDSNANYFQKCVAKAIESRFTKLIFHLAGLNMVSDDIIVSLVAFLKAVKPRGGDIVIVEIPPKVYECFALLGFSYFFNIMDKLDEAVEFFKQFGPFPRIFKCGVCCEKLKSARAEIIRCPKCLRKYAISNDGQISIQDAMNNNEIVPGFDIEKSDKLGIRLQRIEEVPGCLILWLYGYVGEETKRHFQKQIHKAVEAGFVRLIFPLFEYSNYQVPSKEFVSSFVDLSKTVRSKGGDIVLVENPPTIYDLFLQLGYAQFIHSRKDLEEAVTFYERRLSDK